MGGISILSPFKIFLAILTIHIISIASHGAFASGGTPPPGHAWMEISEPPMLGQEFDLTIFLAPRNYDDSWANASDEKKWSTEFTIILPESFEIIDDGFSDGGRYYQKVPDGYRVLSAVRDVGFPPQTTVKIKPTEPGIWQIIATGGAFTHGTIFVTLTESYSYVSDKSNNVVQRDACGKDWDGWYDRIAMFDVESDSIIRNVKNDFMMEEFSKNWKITTNPATGLVYVYEYYTTTIPIIHENSGETKDNLELNSQTSDHARISDIAINSETNLIYMANNGRIDWKNHDRIMVFDGETHSVISTIEYHDRSEGSESTQSIAVNPETNTLYVATGRDNLYIIDLDTERVITKLHLGTDRDSGSYDVEVNSATNKIYVLNSAEGALYVIDGHKNSVEEIISADSWPNKILVNEQDNEIYLLNSSTGKLLVIDGIDHRIITINLHRPGHDMDFDYVHDKLYVTNRDGPLTVIDTNTFDFDILDDCVFVSSISINPKTGILSAIDKKQYTVVNVVESVKPNQNDRMWIDNSEYPRTEYLSGEPISFKLSNMGNADIEIDSVKIQNTNTGNVSVTFTELQAIEQNDFIEIMWDQTDSSGKQVLPDRYAVILKGHDGENAIHEAHKLFSVIDEDRLSHLKSLHNDMFSHIKLNDSNSEKAAMPPASDGSAPANTAADSTSQQSHPGVFSDGIMCKNNPVLVTLNHERFACVKYTTSEKLVLRGWEVVSTKPDADDPGNASADIPAPPRDIMLDFPLSSEFIDNGIARFNVEFSQKPVLNEEFDITITFELLDDEFSAKKSGKTIPFTLTLGEGIKYVGGDMKEIERKYSLVTEQYNTMYMAENPATIPNTHESTSTLKFLQSGERYFGVHVSGQFDAFWFFVGGDGTVHMKEDVTYDYRALSHL